MIIYLKEYRVLAAAAVNDRFDLNDMKIDGILSTDFLAYRFSFTCTRIIMTSFPHFHIIRQNPSNQSAIQPYLSNSIPYQP